MTGAPPVLDRPALWAALSHMQIERPEAGAGFEETLAQDQGWPLDFAERVTNEYRRFLYLAATAGFEVTPSKAVDEAWHLHLACPHYREILCGRILGWPLEHRPATGQPGEQDRHRRQYEDTVALYERAFLNPPPSDIWPDLISPEEQQAAAGRSRSRKLFRGIAGGTGLAAFAAYGLGFPFTALFLAIVATLIALLTEHFFPGPARAANGGGDGCSAGGSDDSGCGSSCGGGCGGD